MTKINLEKWVYFILYLIVHHPEKAKQKLQVGTWRQELIHGEMLSGLICMACSPFFVIALLTSMLGVGPAAMEWALPH